MSWICKFLGDHKPKREDTHYRERVPTMEFPENDPIARLEWDRDRHFERYTTCVRCEIEISYARWFNWWGNKDRIENLGREWLEKEDADKVEPCASARILK